MSLPFFKSITMSGNSGTATKHQAPQGMYKQRGEEKIIASEQIAKKIAPVYHRRFSLPFIVVTATLLKGVLPNNQTPNTQHV